MKAGTRRRTWWPMSGRVGASLLLCGSVLAGWLAGTDLLLFCAVTGGVFAVAAVWLLVCAEVRQAAYRAETMAFAVDVFGEQILDRRPRRARRRPEREPVVHVHVGMDYLPPEPVRVVS